MTLPFKLLSCALLAIVLQTHGFENHLTKRSIVARTTVLNNSLWTLYSSQGFVVSSVNNPKLKKSLHSPILAISVDNNFIMLNGKNTFAQKVMITPTSSLFSFMGHEYQGPVVISLQKNMLSLIQHDAKTYIAPDKIFARAKIQPAPPDKQADSKAQEKAEKIGGAKDSQEHSSSYKVRVLLEERARFNGDPWRLASADGFIIIDPYDHAHRILFNGSTLTVEERNGSWYFNDKKFLRKSAYIVPVKGTISFNKKKYQGGFLLTRDKGKSLLINNLDIEDYVFCVLNSESWPGWPLEVNKVFAIACRSYAIAMIQRSKTSKLPYHIKNTNIHQKYDGVHESEMLKNAVNETSGVFLAHKGQPIIAMFDCCCGGIIPANIKGFDFAKAPYLARPYACTHCKTAKIYNWRVEFSHAKLLALLSGDIPHLKTVRSIKVSKKDAAGLVHEVAVQGAKKVSTISAKKLYSLTGRAIKSSCYTITPTNNGFVFNGHGYGHHMGLCQWGAREMVRKGYDYKEILAFYYPKTNFVRLS